MFGASVLLSALGRQLRRHPLRLILMLLQLALAGTVVTVALHVVQAERSRGAQQTLFMLHSSAPGGQISISLPTFTPVTMQELANDSPDVAGVAAYSSLHYRPRVEVEGEVFMLSSVGRVDAAYIEMLGMEITSGTGFTVGTSGSDRNVMLLEENIAEVLFQGENPLGREVTVLPFSPRVRASTYRVIGTYRYPDDAPSDVQGPLAKLPALVPLGSEGASALVVLSEQGRAGAAKEQMVAAARAVHSVLMRQHEGLDFFVQDPDRPLRFFDAVEPHLLLFALFGVTAMILAGLAVFSMTVVDASERSHELGIRRALGASSWRVALEHAATVGLQILIAAGGGALAALALIPALGAGLGGALLPGALLTVRPLLALSSVLLVMVLGVGLGLVPMLSAGRSTPAAALSER